MRADFVVIFKIQFVEFAIRLTEEAARQEATGHLRHWIERIRREDAQERRTEEEAAARRREEERRVLERESGFPHTPPPRVIRVGASAPVSAISESGL